MFLESISPLPLVHKITYSSQYLMLPVTFTFTPFHFPSSQGYKAET